MSVKAQQAHAAEGAGGHRERGDVSQPRHDCAAASGGIGVRLGAHDAAGGAAGKPIRKPHAITPRTGSELSGGRLIKAAMPRVASVPGPARRQLADRYVGAAAMPRASCGVRFRGRAANSCWNAGSWLIATPKARFAH